MYTATNMNPFTDPANTFRDSMTTLGTVEEAAEEHATMEPTDSTLSLLTDDSSTRDTAPST